MADDRMREEAYRQLRLVAESLGKSPTMREFAAHPETSLRPQQIVKMHGTGGWNAAKQAAGLEVKQQLTDTQLLGLLSDLAKRLGQAPGSKEINADEQSPSASLYIHRFGSLPAALAAAGVGSPPTTRITDEQLVRFGLEIAQDLGRLPGWSDWVDARRERPELPSEWQVYRRFGGGKDAWRLFHYLVFEAAHEAQVALPGEYPAQDGNETAGNDN